MYSEKSVILKKIVNMIYCLFFVFVFVFNTCCVPSFAAQTVTKKQIQREIAIVYDNSGSMYSNKKTWCQATYAVEVFASMLNKGDKLKVFPMNDIEVKGRTYTSSIPLVINSTSEASLIREIYSPQAKDTPIEPVFSALEELKKSKADQKWLIVLTDGATFYEEEKEMTPERTTERLSEVLSDCNNYVNVLYLGIGSGLVVPEISGPELHGGIAVEPENVLGTLSSMCNMIFGRDSLPEKFFSGSTVSVDIPMSKLIVFLQGENVSDVKLSNKKPEESTNPRYNELGGKGFSGVFQVDTTLQGEIATFKDIKPGSYDYTFNGNGQSISIYYEPDVDLVAEVTDEDGNTIEDFTSVYPGKYKIRTFIADSDGKPVESELLGSINYSETIYADGEHQSLTDTKPIETEVVVEDGDSIGIDAQVTFLNNYTITKSTTDFGWPENGIRVSAKPIGVLELKLSGGQDSYKISDFHDQAVYTIEVFYDGTKVTGSNLDRVTLYDTLSGEGHIGYTFHQNDSDFTLHLYHVDEPYLTPPDVYTVTLTGEYEFEEGYFSKTGEVPFSFELIGEKLTATMEVKQKYIQLSKIKESSPIIVNLRVDGEPLTDEKLQSITVNTDSDGLEYEQNILPGQSTIELRLKNKEYETGSHKIKTKAFSPLFGESNKMEDSVELQKWPKWARIALVIGIILLVALLLWLFLSIKILPARITLNKDDCMFVSGTYQTNAPGKCQDINIRFWEPWKRVSKASMWIESPENPQFEKTDRIRITVYPETKIWTVLTNKRSARVKAIMKSPGEGGVKSVNIDGTTFTYDREKGTFVDGSEIPCSESSIRLGNNWNFDITQKNEGSKPLSYQTSFSIKW